MGEAIYIVQPDSLLLHPSALPQICLKESIEAGKLYVCQFKAKTTHTGKETHRGTKNENL